MIDPAFGQRLYLCGGIVGHRIDNIGCAQLDCQRAFFGHRIGSDDPAGPCNLGGIDCRQTNPAATDNSHGFARCNLARVKDCACAGGDGATNDCGAVERHFGIDRNARMFVDQHHFGISGKVQHLRHG